MRPRIEMLGRAIVIAALLLPTELRAEERDGDGERDAWPREASLQHLRTKTAYVIEKGEVEVELVPSYLEREDRKEYPIGVEIETAVSEHLMLELEYGYIFVDDDEGGHTRGTDDLGLEAKYAFLTDGPLRLALGLEGGVEGEVEEGEDEIERKSAFEAYAVASYEVADRWRAHVQAGFEAIRSEGPEKFLNVALEARPFEIGLTPQLALNVEWESNEKPETSLVPGVSFELGGEPLQRIGIGVPIGLSEEAQDIGVIFSFELEF